MHGSMMETPLLVSSIIEHASRFHGDVEIVSRSVEGPVHRTTYRAVGERAAQLAHALRALGAEPGDRIGTLAWNTYRHLEIYYGVSGIGAVCHTINPRLHAEQIAYIVNHADDRWIFTDLTFVPQLEALQDRLPNVRGFVIMTGAATMPATTLRNALCYETLLARAAAAHRLALVRREHRRGDVLHLGHDRRSQGRALLAPLDRAARDGRGDGGVGAARDQQRLVPADRADVPRQRVGLPVLRADDRRQARLRRPGRTTPRRSTTCSRTKACRPRPRCR